MSDCFLFLNVTEEFYSSVSVVSWPLTIIIVNLVFLISACVTLLPAFLNVREQFYCSVSVAYNSNCEFRLPNLGMDLIAYCF